MKEIINSIGTIATLVALVMAMFLGNTLLSILAGIGVVYILFFHDEALKTMWRKQMEDEFKAGVEYAEKNMEEEKA